MSNGYDGDLSAIGFAAVDSLEALSHRRITPDRLPGRFGQQLAYGGRAVAGDVAQTLLDAGVLAGDQPEVGADLLIAGKPLGIIDVGHHRFGRADAYAGNGLEQDDARVCIRLFFEDLFDALDLGSHLSHIVQEHVSLQRGDIGQLDALEPGQPLGWPEAFSYRHRNAMAAQNSPQPVLDLCASRDQPLAELDG